MTNQDAAWDVGERPAILTIMFVGGMEIDVRVKRYRIVGPVADHHGNVAGPRVTYDPADGEATKLAWINFGNVAAIRVRDVDD